MQKIVRDRCGVAIPVFISLIDGYDRRLKGLTPVPLGAFMGYRFGEYAWRMPDGDALSSHTGKTGLVRLVLYRCASSLLTLFLVSAVLCHHQWPFAGRCSARSIGSKCDPQQVAALRHEMGLDQPGLTRYVQWLGGIMVGDLGMSYVANMPVIKIISDRLPNTLILAGITALFSVILALTIGIFSAVYPGSPTDRVLNVLTLSLVATPEFLIATLGVLLFSVHLLWLPSISLVTAGGSLTSTLRSLALPIMSLTCVVVAQMARLNPGSCC